MLELLGTCSRSQDRSVRLPVLSDKCISRPDPAPVPRFSVNTEAATGPLDPSARGSAPMINRSRESSRADRANTFHLPVHAYVPARMAYAKFDFVQIDKRERGMVGSVNG